MLFQVNNNINKRFMFNFLKDYNSFFVFNFDMNYEIKGLYEIFNYKVLHIKQFNEFIKDEIFFGLFSGNIFFCFVEPTKFLEVWFNLCLKYSKEGNMNLVGFCYNNFFLNLNSSYSNLDCCLFSSFSILFFLILLFLNLFFFRVVLLFKSCLVTKKC